MIAEPTETVPQRLQPEIESGCYGTAEAVPSSETLSVLPGSGR